MEKRGDIVGHTVVLRADAVCAPVRGLTMVEVEGRRLDRGVDALVGFPQIGAVHTANGKRDLIFEISAQSLTDLDAVLRRLRSVPGIAASETNLLLATPRSTRARLRRGRPEATPVPQGPCRGATQTRRAAMAGSAGAGAFVPARRPPAPGTASILSFW